MAKTITGGAGDDVLSGGNGNNAEKILGLAGNDTITGGGGNDTIDGGAGNDTAVFSGNYEDYQVTWDSNNGYYIVSGADGQDTVINVEHLQFSDQTVDLACFLSGTMIRTPNGEVAVETVKRGDLVTTSDGRALPVSWLGRQTVSTIFGDPLRILPIRVLAGALGDNIPSRDLFVSPDHAILIDGMLIHAGALVNDTTIIRQKTVSQTFTYYHVELDDHSLILAENTPAETFIDNIDRVSFDNWAEHEALYPDGKPITELPYPRAKAHRQVPVSIRIKLADRAQAIRAAAAA